MWVVNTMPFRRTGSLRKSIEGAAIGEILQYIKRDHDNADIDTDSHKDEWMVGALGVLLSIIWFQRSRGYLALGDNLKKARKRRGCCRTYFRVTAAVMVFWGGPYPSTHPASRIAFIHAPPIAFIHAPRITLSTHLVLPSSTHFLLPSFMHPILPSLSVPVKHCDTRL